MEKKYLFFTVILTLHFQLYTFNSFSQFTKLMDFAGISNGSYPQGDLISDGFFLYGMTAAGGTDSLGTIFKIKPDGTGYSKLLDFNGVNGSRPQGSLFSDGIFLYGMSVAGGTKDSGAVFKIFPDGTGYSKLLDLSGVYGNNPLGSFISDGTFLYGMTVLGGTNNTGTIFKIKGDGTGYSRLFNFDVVSGLNGNYPAGSLIADGTFLYGIAKYGGAQGLGMVFKIKTDGTGFGSLLDFIGTSNGSWPNGSLYTDGTFLYGTTSEGGTSDQGTIFKIKFDGTAYTKLHDFGGAANGRWPKGSLISDGTFLYGMTIEGGTNNMGVLFKIKSDGSDYSNLHDFSGATDGKNPNASLFLDGAFLYGMTHSGGTNDRGTLFKMDITTGISKNNEASNLKVYPNPCDGTFTIFFDQPEIVFGSQPLKQFRYEVSIYNGIGEKIFQSKIQPHSKTDLSKQPNGIYLMNVKTDQGTVVKKLVIQH